jgi:hypothetical protein
MPITNQGAEALPDPYKHLSDENKWRICADVAVTDHLLVKAVCPYRGVIQGLVNMLFKSVVDECRANGILYYTEENYARLTAIVRRRSAPFVVENKPSDHVSGGAGTVRSSITDVKNVEPSNAKHVGKRVPTKARSKTNPVK